MPYEKYIKKDGKLYGPYIYHSRRVDGKVISEYHGQKKINYGRFIWILPLIFLILFGAYFIGQRGSKLTGYSVLDLNANYQEGQALEGGLRLSLKEGELIPASSVLVFENMGKRYEYPLKDLILEQSTEGNFFLTGKTISGSGQGFGVLGTREVYPEVKFTLVISSEEKPTETPSINETTTETTATETKPETSPETTSAETPTEETPTETSAEETQSAESESTPAETQTEEKPQEESSSSPLEIISNFFLSLTPTGNVVVESQKEVQGSASAGNPFTYALQEGEKAEIKPRSVKADSGQLPENRVSLDTEGNLVSVSTNYSEKEKGFGNSYSGENIKEFTINLNELNLLLEQGGLKVGIFYEGEEIVSLETMLGEKEVVSESEIIPEPNVSEILNETKPINITELENITNETMTFIINQTLELTEEERAVLIKEFGNISLEVKSAKTKNGFTIIRYELREYWIEYSYSFDLDNSTLNFFMERDRVKWLKDLAEKLSEQQEQEKERSEFLGNYSV